jgi:hypothetical protein
MRAMRAKELLDALEARERIAGMREARECISCMRAKRAIVLLVCARAQSIPVIAFQFQFKSLQFVSCMAH